MNLNNFNEVSLTIKNDVRQTKVIISRVDRYVNRNLLAPCGTYCGHCPYHIKERTPYCDGCEAQKGHPFWGECKLFDCAKDHDVEHCGLCHDFPCDLFVKQYDPEQGQKSAFMRAGLLAYRKRYGTEKYVEISKKLDDHK